jgi:hypothetical protein
MTADRAKKNRYVKGSSLLAANKIRIVAGSGTAVR